MFEKIVEVLVMLIVFIIPIGAFTFLLTVEYTVIEKKIT